MPEEYEILDSSSTPFYESIIYENVQTGQTIIFRQRIKSRYNSVHYNTEKGEPVEMEINGQHGLYLETLRNEQISTYIICDNGDYILEASGKSAKNDLINLAKSANIL